MSDVILLKGVRIGYPNVVLPYKGQDGKYSAKFYLDPKNPEHKKAIAKISEKMAEFVKDDFKGQKPTPDRICLKKGEDFGKSDFEKEFLILNANEREQPTVVDRDGKTRITDPRKIKGGNIVNAQIALWAQNSTEYGKRINCNLIAVQFVKDDGMTFSSRQKADDSLFEDYTDGEDDSGFDSLGLDDDDIPF